MIGRVIDRYEVVSPLGQGGMGVVYKARDTLLDRFVALKLLPPDKTSDPERRQRFLREAKAASALNHPGIVSVHDVRTVEGQDVIVMELVEGETLEALLARRRLPLGEALGLAAKIADAVGRAHAAGIVHRDLKPSNVMVTLDGVKVLDFGLAKLTETPFPDDDAPTLEQGRPGLTGERVIVGTVAYMSPEQAAGRAVDTRSDVFAFGVVLYEMLTGRHPFRRKTTLETLAGIREEEPEAPERVAPGVPPEVGRTVLRCLQKDPARRWQGLSDLGVVLQDLKQDSESGRAVVTTAALPRPPVARRRWVLGVGTVAALTLGVGSAALLLLRRLPPSEPAQLTLTRLTYDGGASVHPTLSPDGNLVAYASDRASDGQLDIWVQHVARAGATRLTDDPADDRTPNFAPDGSRIVYRSEREGGGIYVVDTLGGVPQKLVGGGTFPRFSPDGTRVLYIEEPNASPTPLRRMFIVGADGGEPQAVIPSFGAAGPPIGIGAFWSPDGTRLLFRGREWEREEDYDWWVAPLDGGAPVRTGAREMRVSPLRFPVAWLPDGRVLFVAGLASEGLKLYATRLSDEGRIEGPPRLLTASRGFIWTPSVARNGRLALDRFDWVVRLWEAALDPATGRARDAPHLLTRDENFKAGFSVSRDGSRLAYAVLAPAPGALRVEIHLRDLATEQDTTPVSFAFRAGGAAPPRLSPDGRWLAWSAVVDGRLATFVAPAGEPTGRQVCRPCGPVAFLSDASALIVDLGRDGLGRVALPDGGEPARLVTLGQGWLLDAGLSRDERWVALLLGLPDGRVKIVAVPIGSAPVSSDEGIPVAEGTSWMSAPRWAPDGRFLYYLSARDDSICVWATPLDPETKRPAGEPFAVVHAHRREMKMLVAARSFFDLSVSDRGLVLSAAEMKGEIYTGWLEPPSSSSGARP
jgi:Tol biopolymer transport system component